MLFISVFRNYPGTLDIIPGERNNQLRKEQALRTQTRQHSVCMAVATEMASKRFFRLLSFGCSGLFGAGFF